MVDGNILVFYSNALGFSLHHSLSEQDEKTYRTCICSSKQTNQIHKNSTTDWMSLSLTGPRRVLAGGGASGLPVAAVHSCCRKRPLLTPLRRPAVSVRSETRDEGGSHDVLHRFTMGRREIVSSSALMLLTNLQVHAEQQEETAYDFHLRYQGNDFPLEYLKNKVTVFVNVASE